MFVRNCWYVAAWSHELEGNRLLARTIINTPLVFYREAQGVVALEDRCPHRAAPLSKGIREAEGIRCRYHGLLFDKGGRCIHAPAQDSVPAGMKVRNFKTVERNTWVWVWMGDPEAADETLIPETPCMGNPEWRSIPGYLHYDVNYLLICDNLLDFSHLPYLHPTTLGGSPDFARILPKVERLPRGVRLKRWVERTQPPSYTRPYFHAEVVDRWVDYDFVAPGVLLMDAGMCATGSGAHTGDRKGALETRSYQALTPETETSTHYFFTQAHNFEIDKPEVTQNLFKAIEIAFEEDRDMIGGQQKNLQLDPNAPMTSLTVDQALIQFRRVISTMIAAEQKA
ncbi:MAG TPA: aromatic ring-hydroxylating dioxygenase subunit alpha [Ramlibacter sp.]|jgi:vanillate O-demethylase monooxygenase subunit